MYYVSVMHSSQSDYLGEKEDSSNLTSEEEREFASLMGTLLRHFATNQNTTSIRPNSTGEIQGQYESAESLKFVNDLIVTLTVIGKLKLRTLVLNLKRMVKKNKNPSMMSKKQENMSKDESYYPLNDHMENVNNYNNIDADLNMQGVRVHQDRKFTESDLKDTKYKMWETANNMEETKRESSNMEQEIQNKNNAKDENNKHGVQNRVDSVEDWLHKSSNKEEKTQNNGIDYAIWNDGTYTKPKIEEKQKSLEYEQDIQINKNWNKNDGNDEINKNRVQKGVRGLGYQLLKRAGTQDQMQKNVKWSNINMDDFVIRDGGNAADLKNIQKINNEDKIPKKGIWNKNNANPVESWEKIPNQKQKSGNTHENVHFNDDYENNNGNTDTESQQYNYWAGRKLQSINDKPHTQQNRLEQLINRFEEKMQDLNRKIVKIFLKSADTASIALHILDTYIEILSSTRREMLGIYENLYTAGDEILRRNWLFMEDKILSDGEDEKSNLIKHFCDRKVVCKVYPAFFDHMADFMDMLLYLPDENIQLIFKALFDHNQDLQFFINLFFPHNSVEIASKVFSMQDNVTNSKYVLQVIILFVRNKYKIFSSGDQSLDAKVKALKVIMDIIDQAFHDQAIEITFDDLKIGVEKWIGDPTHVSLRQYIISYLTHLRAVLEDRLSFKNKYELKLLTSFVESGKTNELVQSILEKYNSVASNPIHLRG